MNAAIALIVWAISWLATSSDARSQIKASYPEFEPVDLARERFLLANQGVSEDAAGLVAGLTIGVRDGISQQAAEQMKTLSLTHLVAVSGANLAIVLASVYFLLAAIGLARSLRFLIGLVAMLAYVLLVGPESSVIRAATMAIFVMVGLWLGRGSSPLNSLALAISLLLILDPALSRDIGFALSALATAGLLLVAPELFEKLRMHMPDVLALGIAASASAQLFTMPVLLILQSSIPIYSVVANVLVEPVVAPITVLGILAVVVSSFSIPMASGLSYLGSLLSSWILLIASQLSSWPEARVHFVPGFVGILILGAVVGLIALSVTRFKNQGALLRWLALSIALIGIGSSALDRIRYETFDANWNVVACDVGQGDALVLRSQGVIALIDVGPEPAPIDRCLKNLGVKRIHLLILTHYDKDHVGGIQGALKGRVVDAALVSGFDDDRPLVKVVGEALQTGNVTTALGLAGMSGPFGSGSWRVLSPGGSAIEADNSNDASLVLAFEFDSWAVLALGDLGESSQLRLLESTMPELDRLASKQLLVKVAHHGSADQSEELARLLNPEFSLFSVGKNNYGHPTSRALGYYASLGSQILRTDQLGPVALEFASEPRVMIGGKLSW